MGHFGWAEGRRMVESCWKTAGARNLRIGLDSIDCGPPQHATLKKSEIQHLDCTANMRKFACFEKCRHKHGSFEAPKK
jgi:hypothetical protein